MSRAEDLSKKYRDFREQCGIKDPVMLNEIEEAYYEGYYQAEKDLELTWEDVERIDDISIKLDCTEESKEMSNKEFYQEVLKRFKDFKERKNK